MMRLDRAEAIQKVLEIRNACDVLLEVLLPDDVEDGCPHPPEKVVDESTLDDDGEQYRCTACNTVSKTPFPSIINKD